MPLEVVALDVKGIFHTAEIMSDRPSQLVFLCDLDKRV